MSFNYQMLPLNGGKNKTNFRVHKTLGMLEQFDKLHLKLPKLVED